MRNRLYGGVRGQVNTKRGEHLGLVFTSYSIAHHAVLRRRAVGLYISIWNGMSPNPVLKARNLSNPTRNGVPCGVADVVWKRRAEGTGLRKSGK